LISAGTANVLAVSVFGEHAKMALATKQDKMNCFI
jgi:hypothetical protein